MSTTERKKIPLYFTMRVLFKSLLAPPSSQSAVITAILITLVSCKNKNYGKRKFIYTRYSRETAR